MPLTARKQLHFLLLGLTLACNEGPSGLSTGNLSVTVSGLPGGSSADLVVTGPGGYSQALVGTQILTQLAPGTYTVAAFTVTVGSASYTGMPETQTAAVGGSTPQVSVLYSTGSGNLSITINGLGTSRDAAVTVTGPNNYSKSIPASETLVSLTPGSYTISAQDVVATGGTAHTASPAIQGVSVQAVGTASATVNYAPPSSGPLNLRVAGFYLTQSTQTFDGSVPLVKDRDGYLRVFAVANRTNAVAAAVRVRIYNALDVLVSSVLVPPPSLSVPTSVDESALIYSWNTSVAGTFIQPGFRIEAEVDPDAVVLESDETDNLFAPSALAVQAVPALNLTLVPVIQNQLQGNVTDANKDEFLGVTRRMHPVAGSNITIRTPYTATTPDTLEDDNGNNAWGTILTELDAARTTDGSSDYYYGVAKVSYSSGVAGVAFVSNGDTERSALGWDYLPTGGTVVAHELGHNWGRNHAPCGGPGGVDLGYPHPDGSTGSYGMDVANQVLKLPTVSDIMGYCEPKWIGSYTYKAVMNYLVASPSAQLSSAVNQAAQPCLLVWGHVRNGELVLEPSFQVHTRPNLPRRPGPYTVQGQAEDGSSLFNLSFSPSEIADAPGSQRSFVFAVPIPDAAAARLSIVRLSGEGRVAVRRASQDPGSGAQLRTGVKPVAVEARRVAGGRVGVRWDARAHPMVMVRDARTGQVLSFARGGSVGVASLQREVDLVFSDGVRSRVQRVPVLP